MDLVYPLFLKLAGAPCLVVGGGPVGARKAEELLAAGAAVTLVSPEASPAWEPLRSRVRHEARAFRAGDARGMRLVLACTGLPDVDDAVARDAREHGALVNAADRNPSCDFYTGAVIRRGPLQVVIGTGGASPALARKVRQRLEGLLPDALGPLAVALGEARPRLLARYPGFAARARVLDAFVERCLARLDEATSRDDVTRWLDEELLEDALLDEGGS